MKKTIKYIIMISMLVFLLVGCGKQVKLIDTFSLNEDKVSVLENLLQYNYHNPDDEIDLDLSNVEFKLDEKFKGKVAVIYSKKFNDELLKTRANKLYQTKEFNSNIKTVSNSYNNIINNIESYINKLPEGFITTNIDIVLNNMKSYYKSLADSNQYTIEDIIKQANDFGTELDKAIKTDIIPFANKEEYKDSNLTDVINPLQSIKLTSLQNIINIQTKLSEKLLALVKNDIDTEVAQTLINEYNSIIKNTNSNIKVVKADKNEKEIFIILSFNKITDMYSNIYIDNIGEIYKSKDIPNELYRDLSKVKFKYLLENLKSPEILAASTYVDDINYRSEILNIIKMESTGKNLVKKYNSQLNDVFKKYSAEAMKLYKEVESIIDETDIDKIPFEEKRITEEAINKLDEVNKLYKDKIDSIFETILVDFESYKNSTNKVKDDSEAASQAIEIINNYHVNCEKNEKTIISSETIFNNFSDLHVAYFYFNEQLPIELRITIGGKYIYKMTASNQIDTADNYHINAIDSGDNAMRIKSEVSESLLLLKLSSAGSIIKYIGIGLVLLFVLLFVINRQWFKKGLIILLLLTISVIVIYPLAWVIGSSFNRTQSLGSVGISPIPKNASLIQYKRLFINTKYLNWYANTLKIAVLNMTLAVLLTVTTAYVFSRFRFKGKKSGLMFMLIIQIFPSFSTMVAIYTLLASIKVLNPILGSESLVNTHLGLLLVYVAGQVPYNTWLVKGYFDTISKSLDEAAKIDGASNLQAFWKVILPLGRPIISFVAVTSFMGPWMDFILPRLLLKSPEKRTLAIGLFDMISGQSNNNFTMFAAGAVLVAVPITILFAYFQKYIVTGLSSGAVKG